MLHKLSNKMFYHECPDRKHQAVLTGSQAHGQHHTPPEPVDSREQAYVSNKYQSRQQEIRQTHSTSSLPPTAFSYFSFKDEIDDAQKLMDNPKKFLAFLSVFLRRKPQLRCYYPILAEGHSDQDPFLRCKTTLQCSFSMIE